MKILANLMKILAKEQMELFEEWFLSELLKSRN